MPAELACVVMSLAAEPGLPEAVRSILAQEGADVELVVVNSGGGEAAWTLDRAGLHVPVIERPERLTAGAVRNLGIAATSAPFVAFLAADCVAEPGWAAARLRRHRAGAPAVAGMVVNPHPRNLPACTTQALLFLRRMPGTPAAHRLLFGMSYERGLLLRCGPFDERVEEGEDTTLNRRIAEEAEPQWAPEVRIAHRHPITVGGLLRDQYARGGRSARVLRPDAGRTVEEGRRLARRVRDVRRMARDTDDRGMAAELRRGRWLAPPALAARYAGFARTAQALRGTPLERLRVAIADAHRRRRGRLLELPYAAATRAVATAMRARGVDASVYLTGSAANGELVPGVSDLDVIVVTATPAERERLDARRRRLERRSPLAAAACELHLYTEDELRDALGATHLTFDLGARTPRGSLLFHRGRARDDADLHRRPRRARPETDWRLVAGPERRRSRPGPTAHDEAIAAWLELQYWWRHAYSLLQEPETVRAPLLAAKLIAEPARVWLRLQGEEPATRGRAIARASHLVPTWERHGEAAARLARGESGGPPADGWPLPVRWALDALVDVSEAIAARLMDGVAGAEHVVVAIERSAAPVAPLADWRARVGHDPLPATLEAVAADPRRPDALRRLLYPADAQPVVDLGNVILLPHATYLGCLLRAAQCPPTDPVTFALLRGETAARFPAVAGWSIADGTARALAEHRSWFAAHGAPFPAAAHILHRCLTAAGAAATAAALRSGRPAIGADPEGIARLAAEHLPRHAAAVEAAAGALRAHQTGERIPRAVARSAEDAARQLLSADTRGAAGPAAASARARR